MHIASLPHDIIDEICFSKVQISVLNISTRGVESARYRLRKRLNLDNETNLTDFLDHLSAEKIPQDLASNWY